jgi:hypothetical protein
VNLVNGVDPSVSFGISAQSAQAVQVFSVQIVSVLQLVQAESSQWTHFCWSIAFGSALVPIAGPTQDGVASNVPVVGSVMRKEAIEDLALKQIFPPGPSQTAHKSEAHFWQEAFS